MQSEAASNGIRIRADKIERNMLEKVVRDMIEEDEQESLQTADMEIMIRESHYQSNYKPVQ